MGLVFELGISSATAITLEPNYDYSNKKRKNETVIRTKSGKAKKYKWGDFRSIRFTLDYVSTADAAVVNSWFDTDTKLLFFVTSDTATEVNSVMLFGEESPFKMFNKPYDSLYKGSILLETY